MHNSTVSTLDYLNVVILFVYCLLPTECYRLVVHLLLCMGICTDDFGGSPVCYNIQYLHIYLVKWSVWQASQKCVCLKVH